MPVAGNVGVSPIAATGLTGFSLTVDSTGQFSTSSQVTGHLFAASYSAPTPSTLTVAIGDMGTAFTDAAGRVNPDFTNLAAGELFTSIAILHAEDLRWYRRTRPRAWVVPVDQQRLHRQRRDHLRHRHG